MSLPAASPASAHGPARPRHRTVGVRVGKVVLGGGAPVVVQSMSNTDTADVEGTVAQCLELAQAGSELVRVTVNVPVSWPCSAALESVAAMVTVGSLSGESR